MRTMSASFIFAVAASMVWASAGAAMAANDDPIGEVLATSASKADDTDRKIADWLKGSSEPAPIGPGAPAALPGPLPVDRGVHGEVGVGVGSHGYREAYGVATMPLGEHGAAQVAVSDARMNIRGRGVGGRSLAVSLAFGDAAQDLLHQPSGCAPAGRYTEPTWVSRMRQDRLGRMACGASPLSEARSADGACYGAATPYAC